MGRMTEFSTSDEATVTRRTLLARGSALAMALSAVSPWLGSAQALGAASETLSVARRATYLKLLAAVGRASGLELSATEYEALADDFDDFYGRMVPEIRATIDKVLYTVEADPSSGGSYAKLTVDEAARVLSAKIYDRPLVSYDDTQRLLADVQTRADVVMREWEGKAYDADGEPLDAYMAALRAVNPLPPASSTPIGPDYWRLAMRMASEIRIPDELEFGRSGPVVLPYR